jgi:mono/diheme cytochrome c family protein
MRTGLTLQAPVPGTIARGQRERQFHYGAGEEEAVRAGRELTNPLPISAATIEDGRGLYQTYCLVCHGANGQRRRPAGARRQDPDAARLHVRTRGAVPARAHLPRRHRRARRRCRRTRRS